MTAVPSGPRDDRAALEEVLARKLYAFRYRLTEPDLTWQWDACETKDYIRAEAAEFIAVEVDAIAEARAIARAQQELRAAADEVRARFGWAGGYGKQLRARADALGGTT